MKKNTENAIVNAIGELGVKLDHIENRLENVEKGLEKVEGGLGKVENGITGLNHKFDQMFIYLKENLDLRERVERLEKEVFKK
jgi:hypothetical protein